MIARTSSAAWVGGVAQMFVAEGLDVDQLFRDAGLDVCVLDDADGRLSIDDVSVLWEMAVARSGKQTLGLSKELAVTYGNLGLVRYAMMACPTLLTALERLARYMNLVSNAATFSVTEDTSGHWIELGHHGGERPVPRQRLEFGMLTVLTSCSWFTGRELTARALEFVYPEPAHAALHRQVFGCPLRYGCQANRALLSHGDLALPLSARDKGMAMLHAKLVEDELERLEGSKTSPRVRRILEGGALHPEPRREAIAVALNVSDRTLQRRLQGEGTSFHQLLDDVRKELAQRHLRKPDSSIKLVAELLGFEDQSNLFRACRRWFGESPGQYRARHLAHEPRDQGRLAGHSLASRRVVSQAPRCESDHG
ncbi:MAG: AraC family transcriptional regulator [Caldimonas sp.]